MSRPSNCFLDPRLSSSGKSKDWYFINTILPSSFGDILSRYLPLKTVTLILSCYQGYQGILNEVVTCAQQLTSIKCDYWQELVFIWDGFMALSSQAHLEPQKAQTAHAYKQVLQQFYLCHIRFFQQLLEPACAINDAYRHKIALYLNKLNNLAYCRVN